MIGPAGETDARGIRRSIDFHAQNAAGIARIRAREKFLPVARAVMVRIGICATYRRVCELRACESGKTPAIKRCIQDADDGVPKCANAVTRSRLKCDA